MIGISDTSLIKGLQQHDEEVFKIVVENYKDMVYNVCLNFINIVEDAQEISQDVFVEVHKSIGSFRGDASLKTWIYRITITKSLEHERRAKRKKRFGFMYSIGSVAETEFESNCSNHPGVEPENRDRAELIFKEIKKLSENQQIAFNLYHIDGMSYKEIVEIMDISLPSVESLIFRAKQNLRKKLVHVYN